MKYDKVVKGATKVKLDSPKAKYIEPILDGTNYPEDLEAILWALSVRLKDSAWTVSYKALIVIHIMIREGAKEATLRYLTHNIRMFDVVAEKGGKSYGIGRYARYLKERAIQYSKTEVDYVRNKSKSGGRLRTLSVEKGLLRECDSVLIQIQALVRCRFHEEDVDNEIVLTAFRYLVRDLLALYQTLNEGVINVLEHYFEMSKVDATHGLEIYKRFTKQTTEVVGFLRVARNLENVTQLRVPNIKHAPVSLTDSLEEYLNDPDFEINHRQYLAEKQAKESNKGSATAEDGAVTSAQSTVNGLNPVQNASSTAVDTNPFHALISQQTQPSNLVDIFGGNSQEYQQQQKQQAQQPFTSQQQPIVVQIPIGVQTQVVPNQTGVVNPWGQPDNSQFAQQQAQLHAQQQVQQQAQLQAQQTAQLQAQQTAQLQAQQTAQLQAQQTAQLQAQQTAQLQAQQTGPFQQQPQAQLTPAFTGAGFGGYSTSPSVVIPSTASGFNVGVRSVSTGSPFASQLGSTTTGSNPFRVSIMPTSTGGNPFLQRVSTVGSRPKSMLPQSTGNNPFSQSSASNVPPMPSLSSMGIGNTTNTGFNFGTASAPTSGFTSAAVPNFTGGLTTHATGTNPFKQNMASGAFQQIHPQQPQGFQFQNQPTSQFQGQPTGQLQNQLTGQFQFQQQPQQQQQRQQQQQHQALIQF
ncbi:hypothetical protein D0Z03_000580 [Geotrichum reessii]|nr:hypothetical protein D0Z03_000580 [Galactomyces reessii]